jgi:uncharacterized peroxidase-related enzyme
MPRIGLPEDLPGIVGLFSFKPATAVKLREIYQELLRGPGPLPFVDRERIAAHASRVDRCEYCFRSHEAVVRALEAGAGDSSTVTDPEDPKLAALLQLAGAVALGGDQVTDEHVAAARQVGASDEEIHDTVLIAAAFCMASRYVNGLAAITPDDDAVYDAMGLHLATHGYLASPASQ